VRFLRVARGSIYEVETHMVIARELGFLEDSRAREVEELLGDAGRVLAGLIRSVESRL
jgi:four helix bundle protein